MKRLSEVHNENCYSEEYIPFLFNNLLNLILCYNAKFLQAMRKLQNRGGGGGGAGQHLNRGGGGARGRG